MTSPSLSVSWMLFCIACGGPLSRETWASPDRCAAVATCESDPQCAVCMSAVDPFFYPEYATASAVGALQASMFTTLVTTPECNASREILAPALAARADIGCGRPFGPCQAPMVACMSSLECTRCVSAVVTETEGTSAAIGSAACNQTDSDVLSWLANDCQLLPQCTTSKKLCAESAQCAQCWAEMRRGNASGAATACDSGPARSKLDRLMLHCTATTSLACDYGFQRCALDPSCNACLSAMGSAATSNGVAWGSLTQPCVDLAAPNSVGFGFLVATTYLCPPDVIPPCAGAVFDCTMFGPNRTECARCVLGNSSNAAACAEIMALGGIDLGCNSCPDVVNTINTIVFATSVVGSVSVGACVMVIFVIVAYSHDRKAMRDRIVIGLATANGVYSMANAVPLNRLKKGDLDCGAFALSFGAIRFWRAWWFAGKYALVCFEIVILGVSLWALYHGAPHKRYELVTYGLCIAGGVAAFTTFYMLCDTINSNGYNSATEYEAETSARSYLSPNDDLDDEQPNIAASAKYATERVKYDNVLQRMLAAWLGFLGVAVIMWLCLRRGYTRLRQSWEQVLVQQVEAEAADEWASTRQSQWKVQREIVNQQRAGVDDVAKPLELYVAVFVLFGIPTLVMSTKYCQTNSRDDSAVETFIEYGTCDVWCELILAFRSLATVAVFFRPRERRAELANFGTASRLLAARICSGFSLRRREDQSKSLGDEALLGMERSTSWHLNEADVAYDQKLAEGAYGVVWRGQWRDKRGKSTAVAIKVLKSTAVDADGDPLDLFAEEDFRKECDMLQRVNHPNLLSFHGFGVTSAGVGFLVTELMEMGSLRGVLQDLRIELSWADRLSIAQQLAAGMTHLHAIPIVHRDLKSANALLAQDGSEHGEATIRAKIADFGTSRLFPQPTPNLRAESSFTGRVQPSLSAEFVVQRGTSVGAALPISVGENITMTAGTGTLLWMAPEVFRGDKAYGPAVDVFSFGIMLWELATRKTPWHDLGADLSYVELLQQLTSALQTGRRPTIPAEVETNQPKFVGVMRLCWEGDPAARPRFAEVVSALGRCQRVLADQAATSPESLSQPLLAAPW
eukprot:m.466603 g.466603  ORF g.466603 m.466603 type:complete len:1083 (-) comp25399_c0_seq1:69-3317(-)